MKPTRYQGKMKFNLFDNFKSEFFILYLYPKISLKKGCRTAPMEIGLLRRSIFLFFSRNKDYFKNVFKYKDNKRLIKIS